MNRRMTFDQWLGWSGLLGSVVFIVALILSSVH
jgi:hypothetical protein